MGGIAKGTSDEGGGEEVRIPSSVMSAARIALNQPDVRAERGRIIVEPIRRREYDIADLINGITDANRHDEIDFGAPIGKDL